MNIPDQFLSEEDLDLRNLSDTELVVYWNLWLAQAQITNDADQNEYSHGVFQNTAVTRQRSLTTVN
jgi:hypothetical protein